MATKTLEDHLDTTTKEHITTIYKKITKGNEFEFMFFNYKQDKNRMGLEHFLKLLEYLNFKSKKNKLHIETNNTLDIIYSEKQESHLG